MKTLVERALVLTEADHQTNIKIPFLLKDDGKELMIDFSYSPSNAKDSNAYEKVKEALSIYVPEEEQMKWATVERYLPLQNLVTVSLSHNGDYIGAHHTKASKQVVNISETGSSKGFLNYPINKGFWELQLNVHCIASENVHVQLLISLEESSSESISDRTALSYKS